MITIDNKFEHWKIQYIMLFPIFLTMLGSPTQRLKKTLDIQWLILALSKNCFSVWKYRPQGYVQRVFRYFKVVCIRCKNLQFEILFSEKESLELDIEEEDFCV